MFEKLEAQALAVLFEAHARERRRPTYSVERSLGIQFWCEF